MLKVSYTYTKNLLGNYYQITVYLNNFYERSVVEKLVDISVESINNEFKGKILHETGIIKLFHGMCMPEIIKTRLSHNTGGYIEYKK